MSEKLKQLRERAHELLKSRDKDPEGFVKPEDVQRLSDELLTYQTELELQYEELLNTQDKLQSEKDKYEVLFEETPAGYVILDSKAILRSINNSFCEIVGVKKNIALGKPFIVYVMPAFHAIFFEKLSMTTYYNQEDFELKVKLKNSDFRWVKCSIKYHFSQDGEKFYLMSLADIDEIKSLHTELEHKNEKLETLNTYLEKRVQEETEKRLQNEQVLFEQKKFADMGRMVNAIAHQWRQPLNSLGMLVQGFFSGDLDLDEQKDYERIAMELIMHMSSTIDDFRNFFKSSPDDLCFDAASSLVQSFTLIQPQMTKDGIDFRLMFKKDGGSILHTDPDFDTGHFSQHKIYGSSSEFKQVVLNLVQNAADAIRDQKQSGRIDVTASYDDGYLNVSFEDNGGGIPVKPVNRVFQPYFTTKEEGKGTGIGLYMSKIIIENHMKGRISVMNTAVGAKFVITLRIVDDAEDVCSKS
ncbi:PAS domain-containing sensor histidine kinase [Limisalsivibrio acetivorans]|uniref:PAS domain-containing sensor histidine kinase n=1 Tax=Limisalsivibrio acetivorans TaxID=1304888 RepID=UPI00138AB3A7|nr:PAS domain-containing sensor histidine kinase [Limisalsivibrio acetivorans]